MEKNFVEILRESLKESHKTLESTMEGVTEEVAHWKPQGKAISIAAAYIHAVVSEDALLHSMVKKDNDLLAIKWAEKMGVSAPHPAMDADWEKNFEAWAASVKIDLLKFKEYAKDVYKQTDDYLATLTDKDLIEHKIDMSVWEMGDMPVAKFVTRLFLSHTDNLTGEISAIKGLQGLKGYPF